MGNVAGFIKRLTGPHRIAWSPDDLDRLRKIYGLSEEQAAEVIQRHAPALCTALGDVKKNDGADLPTKWKFTASDGKVDRVGDVIDVAGIQLADYLRNPVWHFQHDYNQPVGMAPSTYKTGGKLKSVLELGIGIFPAAEPLQRGLAAGMIKACSIGFQPIKWTYNRSRDGIDFAEIALHEISAVTLPCCAGAILDGPVKSLADESPDWMKARTDQLRLVIANGSEAEKASARAKLKRLRDHQVILLRARP